MTRTWLPAEERQAMLKSVLRDLYAKHGNSHSITREMVAKAAKCSIHTVKKYFPNIDEMRGVASRGGGKKKKKPAAVKKKAAAVIMSPQLALPIPPPLPASE